MGIFNRDFHENPDKENKDKHQSGNPCPDINHLSSETSPEEPELQYTPPKP
jgi:hypothetical protein